MSHGITCLGEMLLRLSTQPGQRIEQSTSLQIFYGGAELNTAILLSRLGHRVGFASALPHNALGKGAMQNLAQHRIDTSHVILSGEKMGLYFTEVSPSIRPTEVIYDRSQSAFATVDPSLYDWGRMLQGTQWLHWSGITPAVSSRAAQVVNDAVTTAAKLGIPISADLNLRIKLWQYGVQPSQVMPALLSHCTSLIGDLDALEAYYGFRPRADGVEYILQAWNFLKKEIPSLQRLAMTKRSDENGALVYQATMIDGQGIYRSNAYHLYQVIDRIGSGDAFTAGIIHGALQKMSGQDCISFATACGVCKHSIAGDQPIMELSDIAGIQQRLSTGKIIR
ncbi:MAG: sugar kinase [Cyclobacteriaceae bacterium]